MNSNPARVAILPYRKPTLGRDYWLLDDALTDPMALRARCLASCDWIEGFPHKPEAWPGMRMMPALSAEELTRIEAWVREATGSKRLWVETTPEGGHLNHNCVQVVGEGESEPRPHTDSRSLCRYAAVLANDLTPPGAGSWGVRVQTIEGDDVDTDDAPPEVALVGRLMTCALNADAATAAALASVAEPPVIWEALDVIAGIVRQLAAEARGEL